MIGIFSKVLQLLTGDFLSELIKSVSDIGKQYIKNETDRAEFESRVKIAAGEQAAKVEQAWAQAASDATKATQATLASSPVLQRAWASVLFLQVVVLAWYQVGTSAYEVITGSVWPQPMADIEWAYLLIGAMIGAGPLVFRRGGGQKD